MRMCWPGMFNQLLDRSRLEENEAGKYNALTMQLEPLLEAQSDGENSSYVYFAFHLEDRPCLTVKPGAEAPLFDEVEYVWNESPRPDVGLVSEFRFMVSRLKETLLEILPAPGNFQSPACHYYQRNGRLRLQAFRFQLIGNLFE